MIALLVVVLWVVLALVPASGRFLARHPLADLKFFFFIFALIPVQTLFTYNWLVLPEYISRAYAGCDRPVLRDRLQLQPDPDLHPHADHRGADAASGRSTT